MTIQPVGMVPQEDVGFPQRTPAFVADKEAALLGERALRGPLG